ncbi:large subunit GTPase 1 homolog isoform X2 [Phymastichus coffea]|nr:large subunit GTPase 1 homolog isoform X2 [Phymastichus coffea]
MQDGYDWGQLNLNSVTEESSFQEFLSTAELAGTEFQAEKLNIKFVNPKSEIGILSKDKKKDIEKSHEKNKEFLKIPRRPQWNKSMSAIELKTKEIEEFLEWRRKLALLQESKELIITPYEKNLEFWRQLWRVIERSDVIVQIVDARNPLLFRCEDLEQYVKEVNSNKQNVVLINKADFLTEYQRQIWADYFSKKTVRVAFFSATQATQKCDGKNDESEEETLTKVNDSGKTVDSSEETDLKDSSSSIFCDESEKIKNLTIAKNEMYVQDKVHKTCKESKEIINSSCLLTREELIAFFKSFYSSESVTENITIGLVGYPNVGKSSTINALLLDKKVSVSATPGKTKHFQTLYLDRELLLCDCPGLVMPSFVSTKAEMILNGILPINQMKDHVPPMSLLGTLIPRHIIEDVYGIMIPRPIEGEDPNRPPIAEEILNAHGFNRGFMTQNGQPDNARSARYILKDFVNGKLLYCAAPPGIDQSTFHLFPSITKKTRSTGDLPPRAIRAARITKPSSEDVDNAFFQNNKSTVHVKGKTHIKKQLQTDSYTASGSLSSVNTIEKPWKMKKSKKREKTRRTYAHLDQH